VFWYAVK